jgi:hypothetical protein
MFEKMLYGNVLVNICVFFTIATTLDLILSVSMGIYTDTYLHLGSRLLICTAVSFSLLIFRFFEKISLLPILLLHAIICMFIQVLDVWIGSFFMELDPNAYRDAIRTVFIFYPVIIVGCLLADGYQTMKANRILKKNINFGR